MEPIFNRISALVESVARPIQLFIAATVISGILLFDWGGAVSKFGITEEVETHRFWIVLVFLTAAVLVGVSSIHYLSGKTVGVWKKWTRNREAKHLLTDEAEVILSFLEVQRPDYVDLLSSHHAVRELRRCGFIEMSMDISAGDLQQYGLTELGQLRSVRAKFLSNPEKHKEFIQKTLQAATVDQTVSQYSWMGR